MEVDHSHLNERESAMRGPKLNGKELALIAMVIVLPAWSGVEAGITLTPVDVSRLYGYCGYAYTETTVTATVTDTYLIFADGFESGDLSAWSSAIP
ncbi:MAG: hypothetical protein GY856_17620 [bacterium]|nr:hypothetical protein [bacterium]